MATKTGRCGTATIKYDEQCNWICTCWKGCNWNTACPDGHGGLLITSGTGDTNGHTHTRPTLTVDGSLAAIAAFLTTKWGRPVVVPPNLANARVERTVEGSEEEMARALGLHPSLSL